jgi:hypothetical protein
MNELIRKFAKQANSYTDSQVQISGDNHRDWMISRDEKFADLIVWECMKICEDVMKKDNSALACWSEIKGTFRG